MTRRAYLSCLTFGLASLIALALTSETVFAGNNVQYRNISTSYAVGVWSGADRYGVGIGPATELPPGASALPRALTHGKVTLYIAYGSSKNLIRGWTRIVNPNMKVTIPDASVIKIEVKGFNQVYVNGVKAKSMY